MVLRSRGVLGWLGGASDHTDATAAGAADGSTRSTTRHWPTNWDRAEDRNAPAPISPLT